MREAARWSEYSVMDVGGYLGEVDESGRYGKDPVVAVVGEVGFREGNPGLGG